MNTIARKRSAAFGVGATLAGAAACFTLTRFEYSRDSVMVNVLDAGFILLCACGAESVLWSVDQSLRGVGGLFLLLVGAFILVISPAPGHIPLAIVGGFLAVIGAMFTLIK
jgi:hypothetical protein